MTRRRRNHGPRTLKTVSAHAVAATLAPTPAPSLPLDLIAAPVVLPVTLADTMTIASTTESTKQIPLLADKPAKKFTSASEIATVRSRRRSGARTRTTANLVFTTTTTGTNGGRVRSALVFAVYPDLMKQARWQANDRIDVLFDAEDRTGLLKRVTAGGYALTPRGEKVGAAHQVKFTWYEGMPFIEEGAEVTDYSLTDEGVLFTFPEGTTFERKATA
jgi:hypothetical protein